MATVNVHRVITASPQLPPGAPKPGGPIVSKCGGYKLREPGGKKAAVWKHYYDFDPLLHPGPFKKHAMCRHCETIIKAGESGWPDQAPQLEAPGRGQEGL